MPLHPESATRYITRLLLSPPQNISVGPGVLCCCRPPLMDYGRGLGPALIASSVRLSLSSLYRWRRSGFAHGGIRARKRILTRDVCRGRMGKGSGAVESVVRRLLGAHVLVRLLCGCSCSYCAFVSSAPGSKYLSLYLDLRGSRGFFGS